MAALRPLVLLAGALALVPAAAGAQVRPDLPWRTLTTVNFRIHFTPELRELALRTATNAEWAWKQLAAELPVPRGPVDIVVADNVDFANGYATAYPSNRIVIYARPPVEEMSLRNHEDWNRSVLTHELTHIFELDRAAGWWGVAQRLFGRAVPFFPHAYAPSWILEGIAVHYETKLAGGGRLAGTEFPAYVRAFALDSALPPLDGVAQARPWFPGALSTYLFGSFLVEGSLAGGGTAAAAGAGRGAAAGRSADADAMARLLRVMSRRMIPWRQDANARAAFGESFTARYAAWRDSVERAGNDDPFAADEPGVEVLAPPSWTARYPRFLASGEIIYVADNAKAMPGLYRIGLDGKRHHVGRRNSVDANSPFEGGLTVQAEFERTDPYTVRSDLFIGQGFSRERLTREERLSHPDVHLGSGRIVAVQTTPGSTDLVTLTSAFPFPARLAEGTLDQTWSEPRWSHDGEQVAAVLWERGGRASVVVMDHFGRETQRISPRGAGLTVVSSPVWVPGDTTIIFASDHEGRTMLYLGDARSGAYGRIWGTRTALNTPDVSADGERIVAVELRANGYRVVARPMPPTPTLSVPEADHLPLTSTIPPPEPVIAIETKYSPRRTLRPTWSLPAISSDDDGSALVGLLTGGEDVLGRHTWSATTQFELRKIEPSGSGFYTYAGLGNPTFSLAAQSSWAHATVVDTAGAPVGRLAEQGLTLSASTLVTRPRARFSTFARLGGELEVIRYRTYPAGLIEQLINDFYRERHAYPRAFVSVGISTLQRPGLSVSTMDGFAANATYRALFRESLSDELAHEAILTASAAKSIPFPGYARHVLAVRAAAGGVSGDARAAVSVGGVSGSSLEVLPGLSLGGSARTFFVRGFAPGAQRGVRAAAASAEYRAPLFRIGRGYRFVPAFLQKTSLIAFADGGAAWCEVAVTDSPTCEGPIAPRTVIASAGGELVLDGALFGEAVYRFRLGFARPVRGLEFATQTGTVYFTLGSTF